MLPLPPASSSRTSALALCPPSLILLPEGTSALLQAWHRVPGSAGLLVPLCRLRKEGLQSPRSQLSCLQAQVRGVLRATRKLPFQEQQGKGHP